MNEADMPMSYAEYEKRYNTLEEALKAILGPGFENVKEYSRIELELSPSPESRKALRIQRRMRALSRLTFSRMDE